MPDAAAALVLKYKYLQADRTGASHSYRYSTHRVSSPKSTTSPTLCSWKIHEYSSRAMAVYLVTCRSRNALNLKRKKCQSFVWGVSSFRACDRLGRKVVPLILKSVNWALQRCCGVPTNSHERYSQQQNHFGTAWTSSHGNGEGIDDYQINTEAYSLVQGAGSYARSVAQVVHCIWV